MKCEHENGWFNGNIVIDEKNTTNEEEAVFFATLSDVMHPKHLSLM